MKINFRKLKVQTAIDGEIEEFDVAKTVDTSRQLVDCGVCIHFCGMV